MIPLHAGFMLRPMSAEDINEVVAIERACQPTPWSDALFRDCLAGHYDCRSIVRGGVGGVAGVGEVGGVSGDAVGADDPSAKLAGFVVLSSVLDEVHLLNIAVAPAWQRRGLAWAALRELIAHYRQTGMQYLYLEVREGNAAARALYRQLGFAEVGERKHYYRSPGGRENAILMTLPLSS